MDPPVVEQGRREDSPEAL